MKKKEEAHPLAELAIDDPAGGEWQASADEAWTAAEQKAERAAVKSRKKGEEREPAIAFYDAPPLPDFAAIATKAVRLEGIYGRFVVADDLVHDVSRAKPGCGLVGRPGRSFQFVHFAHELAGAVSRDVRPHAECMAGGSE